MRLFTRLGNEQDMLHEKDYIAAVTKAKEDKDLLALQGVPEGLNNLHNFTSREVSLEILNCGGGFIPRRYGSTGARERQREVKRQTEIDIWKYVEHLAGRTRQRKIKTRTDLEFKTGFNVKGKLDSAFFILELDT